ncbi:MAG: LysR substrate-binding domain-containing protein [Myxococcota bacterium]|nr:LysR substrate-binding domain-containing protein [Myxococcota bacterium]
MIEIRHLRSFLAVAEELHFGRAAERLHMTQPPLTRQIQQLEEALGDVPLFDRSRRRVALTEAGAALVDESRRLLDQLERAVERTRRVARGEAGRLRIGFISTADYTVLPALLETYRRRCPGVDVELLESTGDEQVRLLEEGSLDVGILIPAERSAGLAWLPLYREPLVAVLPRRSPLARRRGALPVKALRGEPFVLFPRPLAPSLYDEILATTRKAGFSPTIGQEARQMQTIIGLVAGGLGVSIVPACMQKLERRDVAYKELTPATPRTTTELAWRADASSGALASFLEVCRRFSRASGGGRRPGARARAPRAPGP